MLGNYNNNRLKNDINESNITNSGSQKTNQESLTKDEKINQSNSNDNDDFKNNIYKNIGKDYKINSYN
jgi:hypothetical protein